MVGEMSYSDRLVQSLKVVDCPSIYIDVLQKFIADEREKKLKFAAVNRGVLTFGKYRDKDVREVYKLDPSYCKWLHEKSAKFLRNDIKEELEVLLKVK